MKTHVSQAYWYNQKNNSFEEAGVCLGPCQNIRRQGNICKYDNCEKHRYKRIAWLDQLFREEISLPEVDKDTEPDRPLTILVAGSPGTGKTTLCSEICYNLALAKSGKQNSLYASTESETHNILANFVSFGYKDADAIIENYDITPGTHPVSNSGKVFVYGREKFNEIRDINTLTSASIQKMKTLITCSMRYINQSLKVPNQVFDEIWNYSKVEPLLKGENLKWPYALVFDSLNIMPIVNASNYINEIIKHSLGIKVLFLVLDVSPTQEAYKIWEHFCDIVIKLDYENRNGYYTRTIEVVKARYQSHIWGKHQFKISRPYSGGNDNDIRRRSHPYRERGGIFIYPSIHYFLSEYKHMEPPADHEVCDTLPGALNSLLRQKHHKKNKGGFPEGRCTAFVGERGGHKSHLAYLHLLHRISIGESGLIISLRDDENMTRNTISRIYSDFEIKSIMHGKGKNDLKNIKEMENEGKIEILYFHPGYVTPEEFFHRIFIAVQKLKRTSTKITVMFNSLDQLSARFPLCAKEDIFIPGLINFLTAEQITSIFIAVPGEKGQPDTQYGLLPMADLILSFKRCKIKSDAVKNSMLQVLSIVEKSQKDKEKIQKEVEDYFVDYKSKYIEEIVTQVVRFSGGQKAGACGILELIDKNNSKLDKLKSYYHRPGLYFSELISEGWEMS